MSGEPEPEFGQAVEAAMREHLPDLHRRLEARAAEAMASGQHTGRACEGVRRELETASADPTRSMSRPATGGRPTADHDQPQQSGHDRHEPGSETAASAELGPPGWSAERIRRAGLRWDDPESDPQDALALQVWRFRRRTGARNVTIALGEPFAEPPDPLLSAVAQFRSLLVEHLSGLVDAACCWLVDACNWVEDRWESVARRLGRFGRRWAVVNAVDQPGAGNQVWAWCATRREAVELAGRFERHEIGFGFYTLPEGGLTVRRWP